ncbi:MAG: hypothetical protein JSS72_10045 [Armatimonadetes bacterium]|nr:hypothetical protein [Armatimonadota bacterium]
MTNALSRNSIRLVAISLCVFTAGACLAAPSPGAKLMDRFVKALNSKKKEAIMAFIKSDCDTAIPAEARYRNWTPLRDHVPIKVVKIESETPTGMKVSLKSGPVTMKLFVGMSGGKLTFLRPDGPMQAPPGAKIETSNGGGGH